MTAAERVGILASVIAVLARIVSTVALVAAVLWIALPALVVASANAAQAEGGDWRPQPRLACRVAERIQSPPLSLGHVRQGFEFREFKRGAIDDEV